jgi:hypothetical protein
MAQFPTGCTGVVVWKVVGGDWFPVNPPPVHAPCTAASIFVFNGQVIHVDANHPLPDLAFQALQAKFPNDIKPAPNEPGSFTLPLVPNGMIVVIS